MTVTDPTAPAVTGPDDRDEVVDDAVEVTAAEVVVDDVLVEEISIDGMCGVY